MAVISQKRCTRTGLLASLWLLAGLVVVMHAARQFTTPAAGGSSLRSRSPQASQHKGMASDSTDMHGQGSAGQEATEQNSGSSKGIGSMVTGISVLAVVGAVVLGGSSSAKAAEGEEPVFNQWGKTVMEGFTREEEDKNMGMFARNTRLFGISHNASLLNSSPNKIIQAGLPFLAMGAVSYYAPNKGQESQE